MPVDERPTLVQRWILVRDAEGDEHLEARWILEGSTQAPTTTTHAA